MSENYLNGKVVLSSLAVPTEADMAIWRTLSQQEQQAVLVERGQRSHASGTSDRTLDDILVSALEEAEKSDFRKKRCAL